MWIGLIVGIVVALANSLPGWVALWWAMARRPDAIVKVTMGGALVRLVAAAAFTFGLLAFTPLSPPGYVVGLATTYIASLILEVTYLHRRAGSPRIDSDSR